MTRPRDSTHVDTVGEKHGRVVLTWRLHWNTRPILHDGPRRWPAVKMAVLFGGATPRNPPIMGATRPPIPPSPLGRPVVTRVTAARPGRRGCHGHSLGATTVDRGQL